MPENPATAQQIGSSWAQWFRGLPDGSRVLDIGTGNGIVLALASVAAREVGKRFELTGVDLAPIDPLQYLSNPTPGLRDARFFGGVEAEKLPFEAGSFDAVVSQYGLEYADLHAGLMEVERVIAPGGRLRWLAHCEHSDVVAQNASQQEEVEFLLADEGPIVAMKSLAAQLTRQREMGQALAALRAALERAERYCRTRPAKVIAQVCSELAAVAERLHLYRPDDLLRMVMAGERQLRLHHARIGDLAASVLTPPRIGMVMEVLRSSAWKGLRVSEFRVGTAGGPIGLLIEAQRRATP